MPAPATAPHHDARRRHRRPLRRRVARGLLVLLGVLIVAALLLAPWLHAQWRALLVVGEVVEDVPVVSSLPGALTREPVAEEVELAGVEATLMHPAGDGPWPTVVFITGASETGRHHPQVQALLRGLARGGVLAAAPDVPGMAQARLTERGVDDAAGFVRALAARNEVRSGQVTLSGVSAGASLALAVAADEQAAATVAVVAGIAPLVDLEQQLRLATTGTWRDDAGTLHRYETDPFLAHAMALLAQGLIADDADRARFGGELDPLDISDAGDDERAVRRIAAIDPTALGAEGRAWRELLANRDPSRFDVLLARLPSAARGGLERLSPRTFAGDVRARVLLASAPRDSYVPLPLQRALVRELPDAELTVTSALDHAIPGASDLPELARFDWWVMRVLRTVAQA